jgi:hypothetical protein
MENSTAFSFENPKKKRKENSELKHLIKLEWYTKTNLKPKAKFA